jgi:hypothetical protein
MLRFLATPYVAFDFSLLPFLGTVIVIGEHAARSPMAWSKARHRPRVVRAQAGPTRCTGPHPRHAGHGS